MAYTILPVIEPIREGAVPTIEQLLSAPNIPRLNEYWDMVESAHVQNRISGTLYGELWMARNQRYQELLDAYTPPPPDYTILPIPGPPMIGPPDDREPMPPIFVEPGPGPPDWEVLPEPGPPITTLPIPGDNGIIPLPIVGRVPWWTIALVIGGIIVIFRKKIRI